MPTTDPTPRAAREGTFHRLFYGRQERVDGGAEGEPQVELRRGPGGVGDGVRGVSAHQHLSTLIDGECNLLRVLSHGRPPWPRPSGRQPPRRGSGPCCQIPCARSRGSTSAAVPTGGGRCRGGSCTTCSGSLDPHFA